MNDSKIRGTSFQLKKLTLKWLRNVTHVWQQGIPGFQNLQEVTVYRCRKLNTLFPAALARDLKMLDKLDVNGCDELQEIVGKKEGAEEGTEKFVFPRLTELKLRELRQLTHFYSERFTLECPQLNILQVTDCNKLGLFQSQQEAHSEGQGSTSIIGQPLFSDIKAISTVETLCLNWKEKDTSVLRSWLGQPTAEGLQYLYELVLCFDDENENSTFPFEILEKTPYLETMGIAYYHCGSLKKLFPSHSRETGSRMLGNLKRFYLHSLSELHSIAGLECLTKLQLLCVYDCPRLTISAQSCSNLKELHIHERDELTSLFTSSEAKMLIHLEEMYIDNCGSMKEILGKQQNETATATEEIKFERLERIRLESLESLECFYSGNATLKLPSLIQMDIVDCPEMRIFSRGNVEHSRRIQVSYDPNDDLVFHYNLNAAVVWQFLRETRLDLGDYPQLKEIWLGKVPIPDDGSSSKLKYLEVEGCEFLSNAILPSHLLPFLSNLEELVVRKCDSVEAIFDVKDTPTYDSNMIVIRLKKLTLEQLPTLRHVWNKDPKGSLNLPFLEEVTVNECKIIKSLFPASVPKHELTKLDVRNCVELLEIVAKDEAATERANKEVIMFPMLTSLTLWDLPNLRCICSGKQILDWPMLKELDVYHCQMLEIFATDSQDSPDSYPEGRDHITTDKHGFVSVRKVVTPYLERLSLNKEDVIMIEKGLLHVNFQKVKFLRLQSLNDESDAFPDVFFSKVSLPSIQKFVVADSAFREIFSSQRPDIDYTRNLSQLKELELRSLQKLNSIGLEHSWMALLLENLQGLRVLACSCLTNLALSTVSFIHLAELHVEDCARLEYLLTSSTAKTLVALKKMSISNCESLETVVAHEEGDKPNDDVIFEELTTLSLSKLPKLGSFYAGKSTLKFPCLFDVSITQCKRLQYLFTSSTARSLVELCEMSITNCESLEKAVAHEEEDKLAEDMTFPKLWKLTVSELPKVGSFYEGKSSLKFPCLSDFSITQCKRLQYLFTSSTAESLVELCEMSISNCESLETVVAHEEGDKLAEDMTFPQLRKLTLSKLPKLGSFYAGKSTLNFPLLDDISITQCKRLEYLFTSSTAKNLFALGKISISNCESLETVAHEEGDKPAEDMTFPRLQKLTLSELPKLGSFYARKSTLNFPLLDDISVTQCKRLEYLFTSSTAKSLFALGKISISNCELLETVVAHEEGDIPAEDMTFPQLRKLTLSELPKLGSFYARKSTLNFPWLDDISITQCKRLEYLFTSSTAKSLAALGKISISNCKSLETVVAHEEGDKSDEDVTFPRLWDLTLRELPKLGNFYTGKSILCFPQLRCVSITQCKSMKTFSHSNVVECNLETVDIDGVNRLDDDLNTAIHQQFEKEAALSNEIVACSEKLTHIAFNHASLED